LNPSPKKIEKMYANERGIRCSVCYIFVMMIKIGEIGMKFEKPVSSE
jgi:hypothetical protein